MGGCFPSWEGDRCYSEHVFPGISFGAACPLNTVEKTLQDAVAELPVHKTEVFRGVLEQLRWFAGRQVKSVAVSPEQGPSRPRRQGLRREAGRLVWPLLQSLWASHVLRTARVCVDDAASWASPSGGLGRSPADADEGVLWATPGDTHSATRSSPGGWRDRASCPLILNLAEALSRWMREQLGRSQTREGHCLLDLGVEPEVGPPERREGSTC